MTPPIGVISAERLSDLVGRIYDCAVAPDCWPETMREICRTIECMQAVIEVIDLRQSTIELVTSLGISPDWAERHLDYGDDFTGTYPGQPIDEPLVTSRRLPPSVYTRTRFWNEWARPQRLCDFISNIVFREPGRIGIFGASRHDSTGPITDDQVAVMQLLGPHIRRSVTVGDVIGRTALEAYALAATLDQCEAGVAVVAENNRILHANAAARDMFASGGPISSIHGRLAAPNGRAMAELETAVALARRDETTIGASGLGVALSEPGGKAAVAHVLPLARGGLRTRLAPQATAAVFVKKAAPVRMLDLAVIAIGFGLTPAETRLLELLASGASLGAAAEALAIAGTTAKTHLMHIFSKTGVSRQADLIALINRLAPPVERPMRA